MKRILSIVCILLILLGAGAVYLHENPDRLAVLGVHIQPEITLDPTFQCGQGEGLTRIVSAAHPLEQEAEPEDLVELYAHKERAFELSRSDITLRQPAFDAAQAMFSAAKADGVTGFILTSGYRTYAQQKTLYDEADGSDYVNAPGQSEHELGLCFDVTARTEKSSFEETPQFVWMQAHAAEYGFILRYPEGKEVYTGVPYESWHYRFVGVEAAAVIAKNGWCLEEYNAQN